MDDTLRKLLNAECEYRMKDETMDMFIGLMTEIKLKRNQVLTPYNTFDDNIYVIKQGIIRTAYFDGFKEVTFAFAPPGTLKLSYYPLVKGIPSFTKYVACCDSVIMKTTKAQFNSLMRESHDFALWVYYVFLGQFYAYEKKREIVNGNAKERFEALVANRPEIIENVSSRVIASYIGVSPEYLCRLEKQFPHKKKK